MPTSNDQQQPPHPELEEGSEAMEASAPIAEEGEALPEASADAPSLAADQAEEDPSTFSDDSAPFAGADSDPGLSDPVEASEEDGESVVAEPIVYRELSGDELQAAVEATLFMHHKPISINRIRELVNPNIEEEEYRTALSNLMATFFEDSRGIELVEIAGGFQFRTKIEHKDIIRRIYQISPMKLTNSMLEVLAIAAYNQPLTRETIDKIRGVDSSHLVRVLLDKKMLRIAGKSDDIGRPMIYATTKEFLELFGLRDLSYLPSLRDLEEMLPKNEVGAISEEEALASEMVGIVADAKPLEFNDLELEELENEAQKAEEAGSAQANSNGSQEANSASEEGREALSDGDLPPEIARRISPGQEGNA